MYVKNNHATLLFNVVELKIYKREKLLRLLLYY